MVAIETIGMSNPTSILSVLDTDDSKALEDSLHETLGTIPPAVRTPATRAVDGGKRLRPLLVRAWHSAVGGSGSGWIGPATCIELIHRASLVHDDLPCMDNEMMRNGRRAVHAVHGSAVAVLAGDALLAASFRTLATTSLPAAATIVVADTITSMCAGQIDDCRSELTPSPSMWERICEQKTGSHFGAAARLGVFAAGVTDKTLLGAAGTFGNALGVAYQLLDDIADGDPHPGASIGMIMETRREIARLAHTTPRPMAIHESLDTIWPLAAPTIDAIDAPVRASVA